MGGLRAAGANAAAAVEAPLRAQKKAVRISKDYDGLDDLPEETFEEWAPIEEEEVEPGPPGSGIETLDKLWKEYQNTNEEPELKKEEFKVLHASLQQDLPRCPSVARVAWAAHALDVLNIPWDDTYEVMGSFIKDREKELDAQALVDTAVGFGNVYWGDRKLVRAIVKATRKQMKDITNLELIQIVRGLSMMNALLGMEFAGFFYEVSRRIAFPAVNDYLEDAVRLMHVKPSQQDVDMVRRLMIDMPNSHGKAAIMEELDAGRIPLEFMKQLNLGGTSTSNKKQTLGLPMTARSDLLESDVQKLLAATSHLSEDAERKDGASGS